MATVEGQPNYAHYSMAIQEEIQQPSSPTFTNPDLILPNESHYGENNLGASHMNQGSNGAGRRTVHFANDLDGSGAEVGIATAVMMPVRLSVAPPANVVKPSLLSSYQGYEHGAPLSDIGEEETEIEDNTPGPESPQEKDRSTSPSEMDEIVAEVESLAAPPLRHKKRLSNISVGSADSDRAEWDKFDTTKLVSDRVAADIARARNAADTDSVASRRNSKENDEELSILNDRAEQILESARKRLSHMEDNLTKARHSISLSSSKSSPNMHELGLGQQPGGGLYRSISLSAQNRRSRGFPVKPNTVMSHGRAGSDNLVAGGNNRRSRTPEVRSVSALEYGRPWLGVTTPEKLQDGQSPSSSRSFSSPLRILSEEAESPSTIRTSPGSGSTPTYVQNRGLGIHSAAARAQEDLSHASKTDRNGTPTSIERPSSQASTRSARDLKDQMTEMKSRIAELRSKAQADTLRRRSVQNLRSSSPFNSSSPDRWRPASPADYERAETSLGHNTNAGNGWRSISQQSHHRRKDSALDDDSVQSQLPVTPTVTRLLDASTPAGASSARTDRNTPHLAYKNARQDADPLDIDSHVAHSQYEASEQDLNGEDEEDEIFANEEEQIYLNEVLEESLHEPDVPAIPTEYLNQNGNGEERHEDRLDAFDYENMFLHSAMGTYTGHSDSDNDESDAESIETRRRDNATPVEAEEDNTDDSDDSDAERDLNDSDEEHSQGSSLSPTSPSSNHNSPVKRHNVVDNATPKHHTRPVMKTTRSDSMESISSAATFETATEGNGRDSEGESDEDDENEEDSPDEILNWAAQPAQNLSAPVQSKTLASSPLGAIGDTTNHVRHDSGNAFDQKSRNIPSPSVARKQIGHVQNATKMVNASGQHASQHNGQIPRYSHQRNESNESDETADGQTTPLASSFPHHQTNIPRPRGLHTPSSSSSSSSGHVRNSSNSTVIPARQTPSQLPRSTKQTPSPRNSSSAQSHRRIPSKTSNTPRANSSRSTSSRSTTSTPQSVHPANTEILMESLIKLADPSFSIRPDTRFAELDKELVLNLLRALGGVCDGILRAEKQGESTLVKDLRSRLSDSEEVLVHGLGSDEDEEEEDGEDMTAQDQLGVDDTEDEVVDDIQSIQGLGIEGALHPR